MSAATKPLKEVLLVGFGAVGSIYSLILKRSGLARVTVVARSNYEIVKSEGMHFKSGKYGTIQGWRPDRLCKSVAEAADKQYSYVVVATKSIPELNRTPKMLAPLLSQPYVERFQQPTYVLMQNGLNVEADLYESVQKLDKGKPSVLSCAVWIGANLSAPNVVEHSDFDRVNLGLYEYKSYTPTKGTPEETEIVNDFGNILSTGGTTLTVAADIQRLKYTKNFWNVAFSSFATLTRFTLPAIYRPPPTGDQQYAPYVHPSTTELVEKYAVPVIEEVMKELVVLGEALGFNEEEGTPKTIIESVRKLHSSPESKHVPSMLLDAQNGLPIEVEVILGEVVRLAKQHNVSVPRVETLYALLLIVQNQIIRQREEASSRTSS